MSRFYGPRPAGDDGARLGSAPKPGKPLLDEGDKGALLIIAVIITPAVTVAALIVSFAS